MIQSNNSRCIFLSFLSLFVLLAFAFAPFLATNGMLTHEESTSITAVPYGKHVVNLRHSSPMKFLYSLLREAVNAMSLTLLFVSAILIPRFNLRTFIPQKMKSLLLMPIKFTSTYFLNAA